MKKQKDFRPQISQMVASTLKIQNFYLFLRNLCNLRIGIFLLFCIICGSTAFALQRNGANQGICATLVSKSTGDIVTSGTTTVYVKGDNNVLSLGTGTVSFASSGDVGLWCYQMTQAETNYAHVSYLFTNAAAVAQERQTYPGEAIASVITGLIESGSPISSTFKPVRMSKGDNKILQYQIFQNGVAKDLTGMTAKIGMKQSIGDATYKIGPVSGALSNDGNGVKSIITFTIPPDSTKSMTPFIGVYEIAIYGASGEKTTLTQPGGVEFKLIEDVLDVP